VITKPGSNAPGLMPVVKSLSDLLVEGTRDNICLLLGSQLDEVDCISGYADGELRIVLRMLLSVQKGISVQNVYVKMMAALGCVTIKQINQVIDLLSICCHFGFLL
jgi:hypothetical protein